MCESAWLVVVCQVLKICWANDRNGNKGVWANGAWRGYLLLVLYTCSVVRQVELKHAHEEGLGSKLLGLNEDNPFVGHLCMGKMHACHALSQLLFSSLFLILKFNPVHSHFPF